MNFLRICLSSMNFLNDPIGITNPYSFAKSICEKVKCSENCDLSINDARISSYTMSNTGLNITI